MNALYRWMAGWVRGEMEVVEKTENKLGKGRIDTYRERSSPTDRVSNNLVRWPYIGMNGWTDEVGRQAGYQMGGAWGMTKHMQSKKKNSWMDESFDFSIKTRFECKKPQSLKHSNTDSNSFEEWEDKPVTMRWLGSKPSCTNAGAWQSPISMLQVKNKCELAISNEIYQKVQNLWWWSTASQP